MLNGIYPIILFNFKKKINIKNLNIPLFMAFTISESEGICLNSQSKQIQIASETFATYTTKGQSLTEFASDNSENDTTKLSRNATSSNSIKNVVKQKPTNEIINIELSAGQNKILLSLFLTLTSFIFDYLKSNSPDYTISYYSGDILGVNCKLANFSYQEDNNTDLKKINLTLIKENNDTNDNNIVSNKIEPLGIGDTPIL